MTRYLIIAHILLLALLVPLSSHAFTECAAGTKVCEPFVTDPEKYDQCMRLVCAEQLHDDVYEKTQIWQCELGYQRCDVLREEPLYYWTCVDDTCKNPPKITNPTCDIGHNYCTSRLDQYWLCMSSECQVPYGSNKQCTRGEKACSNRLNEYWGCVKETCLGTVHHYRSPEYYTEEVKRGAVYRFIQNERFDDLPPEYGYPPLKDVPEEFRYAPKGVNPRDWLSAARVAPERIVKYSPVDKLECPNRQHAIYCSSIDVSSCQCSDGSSPTIRNQLQRHKRKRIEEHRLKYSKEHNPLKPFYTRAKVIIDRIREKTQPAAVKRDKEIKEKFPDRYQELPWHQ